MMSIQASVNQTLSLAGVLASRGRAETEKVERQQKADLKAQEALKKAQAEKRKTRRNFLKYMQDEPTSLGVKFGDLPKTQQMELAKAYSKSERKAIMDRKDAVK